MSEELNPTEGQRVVDERTEMPTQKRKPIPPVKDEHWYEAMENRSVLQQKAKKRGLPARVTNAQMIKSIKDYDAEHGSPEEELTPAALDMLAEEQRSLAEGMGKIDELYQQGQNEPVLESGQEPEPNEVIAIKEVVPPTWRDTIEQIMEAWPQNIGSARSELASAEKTARTAKQLADDIANRPYSAAFKNQAQTLYEEARKLYEQAHKETTQPLRYPAELEIAFACLYVGWHLLKDSDVVIPAGLSEFFAEYSEEQQAAVLLLRSVVKQMIDALLKQKLSSVR